MYLRDKLDVNFRILTNSLWLPVIRVFYSIYFFFVVSTYDYDQVVINDPLDEPVSVFSSND